MAEKIFENQYLNIVLNEKGYVRIAQKTGGAVIIPAIDDAFILIEHQRGDEVLLEFPRGFLEPGEAHREGGARELKEELNLDARSIELLGELRTDSGLINDNIAAVKCCVETITNIAMQNEEGVLAYRLLTLMELRQAVKEGRIKDNFTLAALMLLIARN